VRATGRNEPDIGASVPYVSGQRYAAESDAIASNFILLPQAQRRGECAPDGATWRPLHADTRAPPWQGGRIPPGL